MAHDSPAAAQAFARRVRAAVVRLADFPLSGRVVPEYGRQRIREIIVGNYRIIYRYSPEEVEIATVLHGARLLGGLDPK
jgi:toxin ParE1/3/4